MPNIVWLFDGTDATQGTQFFSTVTTATNSTIGSNTDPDDATRRVLRITNGATQTTGNPRARRIGILADTGRRVSVRIRISNLASASAGYGLLSCNVPEAFTVKVTNTGAIRVLGTNGGTLAKNSSNTVSTGQFFRLCVAYRLTSTTDYTIKVWVDGVLFVEATGADGTLAAVGPTELQLGTWSTVANWPANATIDYKDCVVDDGGPSDGDMVDANGVGVRVTNKSADAGAVYASNSNYLTRGTGAINERPISTTNGQNILSNTNTGEYSTAIQAANVGDVDISTATYVGAMGWLFASGVSTDQIVFLNNAAAPTNPAIGSTATIVYAVNTSSSYPQDGSNRTIGIKRPNGNSTDSIYGDGGVLVAYIPVTFTTFTRAASIDATGSITTVGRRDVLRAAAIDGVGTVDSSAIKIAVLSRSVTLDCAASIEVSGTVVPAFTVHERTAAVDGVGSVTASGEFFSVFERSSAFDGAGNIEASGIFFSVTERSASIDATGLIATVGQRDLLRASAINAVASISASGHRIFERSAAISAASEISSAAAFFSIFERSSLVNGSATLTASGQTEKERSVSLGATATIEASGFNGAGIERSVSLDATGLIATTGRRDLLRSSLIDAAAGIATSGHAVLERSAALNALAEIESNSEFYSTLDRASTVSATATITVAGHTEKERSVSFNATASIASQGFKIEMEIERSAALDATGTINADGEFLSVVERSAGLNAAASVEASGYFFSTTERAVTLSATAGISAAAQKELFRSASFDGIAAITVSGGIGREFERSVSFTAVATISVSIPILPPAWRRFIVEGRPDGYAVNAQDRVYQVGAEIRNYKVRE